MHNKSLLAIALGASMVSTNAVALNIVLTNDDSFETTNIQQLKLALEVAGHAVIVSSPCAHQSGKGGSLGSYLVPVPVHLLEDDGSGVLTVNDDVAEPAGYCVGDEEEDKATKTFEEFVDATPVQASLHGITKANEIWGSNPDLLISGPNEGQNVGFAVFMSGTLGAAHVAILNNVPAIAVSAGTTPDDETEALTYAQLVASKTVAIVSELELSTTSGAPLLPEKVGLNINLPDAGDLTTDSEFKFTKVNWATGFTFKFGNLGEAGGYGSFFGYTEDQGLVGLNFLAGQDASGDTSPESEGNAIGDGYIAISTLDATENASNAKQAYTKLRLNGLVQ